MLVNTRIRNLTDPERAQFESYLAKKLDKLRPVLTKHYPDDDTVRVRAEIEKFEKHSAFAFECTVTLPKTKPIFAKEVKHTITEVLDFTMDIIEQRLHKHFEKFTEK